jgi:hypothetical protein
LAFIVQKAFKAQILRMRGLLLTLGGGIVVFSGGMLPDAALARETDQAETANCTDPKHRHIIVRPLTEPAPIRKTDKVRVRRILM